MRINKVTLKVLSIFAVLAIVAIPLSNLIIKSADPFKPSAQKIDSSSLVNYYQQSINWQDCYGGFKCATYKVPRDYSNLNAGEFDIAVMKHEATGAVGNLVVNPGGPGGSGIDYVYSYESAFTKAINESFNIVGFDPRGVGRSAPIDCLSNSETDQAYASNSYPDNAAEMAKLQADSQAFAKKCKAENKYLAYYSTANATANWTINFRGSSTATLANVLSNANTITCTFMATQGATAYYNSAVQVDGTGTGVTTKWQGGTAPTSGDTSAVDVYNYVITKTSTTPTYTVLASVTKFA